ncbi:MAG: glutaredoxin 3 [Candidatus Contendobacter sp.]|nr:glutaredoxin 3 [Candidatus Contendobacter sp.]MDS4058306.1 glutaredoxin 3 [Candidatus Contendobacter sp.]
MSNIVLYSSEFCPYCRRARALLDRKGVTYAVLDVDRDPRLWREIAERAGRATVPQIFIGDRHLGGCDDLVALDRRGELDSLLNPL